MVKTVQIKVTGKVQGVYFRQSTKQIANELGIGGWVKNEQDGSVRILATGSEDQLQQLADWCHQGPPAASVARVEVNDAPLKSFNSFIIARGFI